MKIVWLVKNSAIEIRLSTRDATSRHCDRFRSKFRLFFRVAVRNQHVKNGPFPNFFWSCKKTTIPQELGRPARSTPSHAVIATRSPA